MNNKTADLVIIRRTKGRLGVKEQDLVIVRDVPENEIKEAIENLDQMIKAARQRRFLKNE